MSSAMIAARLQPRRRAAIKRGGTGFLYTVPALASVILFFIVPLAGTIYISFHRWPLYGPHQSNGLTNYKLAYQDALFRDSLIFTAKYTGAMLVLGVVISFALALMVHRPRLGTGALRTIFFLPVTIGTAAAGYLWFYMLNGQVGVINKVLTTLHVTSQPVDWLGSSRGAFWSIVVVTLWKTVGFPMVIFLMGMQGIGPEIYEAADMDGAGPFATVRRITIPLLKRSFVLVTVLSIVTGALSFDQFFTMTRGGPVGSTVSAVYSIYLNGFSYQSLGYGSALAVILLVILLLISGLQIVALRGDD
jgi:multiple sugar transport system permease protein